MTGPVAINDETLRLAKALRVSINSEVDVAVRQIVRSWARAWDEIHTTWADAMMDLAQASTDGTWPAPWVVARSDRAQAALLAATDQIVELSNFAGVTITDGVGKIVNTTGPAYAEIMASQLPEQAGVRADLVAGFNRMDELALNRIVDRTAQQITAATYQLAVAAQEAMRRVLIQGVAVGTNPRTAARQMVRRAEGAFNGGLTRALTIARTEMLDAHRAAGRGNDVGNADLVTGWVWSSALDTRTCPSCWAMDGTEHDIDESGPDDHQQGRCARIPKVKSWRELGFDLDEPASVMPDARTVFDTLPQADRLTIMGPERLRALDDGLVGMGDLATRRTTVGWRDSWAPTPIRDLLAQAS